MYECVDWLCCKILINYSYSRDFDHLALKHERIYKSKRATQIKYLSPCRVMYIKSLWRIGTWQCENTQQQKI